MRTVFRNGSGSQSASCVYVMRFDPNALNARQKRVRESVPLLFNVLPRSHILSGIERNFGLNNHVVVMVDMILSVRPTLLGPNQISSSLFNLIGHQRSNARESGQCYGVGVVFPSFTNLFEK